MQRFATSMITAAAVALIATPIAEAKGPYSARVCGVDACRVVDTLPPLLEEGSPVIAADDAPLPGPYYRIALSFEPNGSAPLRLVYVPSRQILSGFGGFKRVDSRFPAGIKKILHGIAPFPAPARPRSEVAVSAGASAVPVDDGGNGSLARTSGSIALVAAASLAFGSWLHRRGWAA